MSYIRIGEDDSDVYVYLGSQGLVCCGPSMGTDEMIEHLRQHEADGALVPEHVYVMLDHDRDVNDRVHGRGRTVDEADWLAGWQRRPGKVRFGVAPH